MSKLPITPGLDGNLYWFNGVVENVASDPRKLGRVQVRIFGKDSPDLGKMPSENLAWASCLKSSTSAFTSNDVRPGDWVFGFFRDGEAMQQPAIIGVWPGVKSGEYDTSKGFSPQLTSEQKKELPVPPEGIITCGNKIDSIAGVSQLTRGMVSGTLIQQTNADRVHVCDISAKLRQQVIWEKIKKSELIRGIREAIEALLRALGFIPDSGESIRLVELAKWIKEKLEYIKMIIDEITEYAKIVTEVARVLRAIYDWLLSLPAKLQSALSECIQAFLSGIGSLISDLTSSGLSVSGSGIGELVSSIKSVVTTAESVGQSALNLISVPAQFASALATPSSAAQQQSITNSITAYAATVDVPTAASLQTSPNPEIERA